MTFRTKRVQISDRVLVGIGGLLAVLATFGCKLAAAALRALS